jgi:cell wall assembly regulator SMI1
MSVQIRKMFEPVTEEQIVALEQKLKFRLPRDYREFLLLHNGGSPEPGGFLINVKQGESNLDTLFGITSDRSYDLWANALDALEDTDGSFLPIGEDPGGNQVYMSLHPDRYGQIVFRDHERQGAESLFPIASNFSEFLAELH